MGIKQELIDHSRWGWERLRRRLDGLDDAELDWSPVAGAWTVRTLRSGRPVVDGNLWPVGPAPFTTLAWRLAHLVDVYGSARNARWLGGDEGRAVNDGWWHAAVGAEASVALLVRAADYWHGVLEAADEDRLWQQLGPQAGQYASSTGVAFVLHQLDEAIHHGAEVGVLRDLYRSRDAAPSEPSLEDLRTDPDGARRAADLGRWDLVEELVLAGAPLDRPGRGALHQAAATGDPDLVRLLVDHGAPLDAIDPDFSATPAGWAQFFGRHEVLPLLEPPGA